MGHFLRTLGASLPIAALALVAGMATPAWAGKPVSMPVSGVGIVAGAAIIGALVITKLLRRK